LIQVGTACFKTDNERGFKNVQLALISYRCCMNVSGLSRGHPEAE